MATVKRPKLDLKSPIPSDIEIAQAATPLPIASIADQLVLAPDDYNQYGPTAAKVCVCVWGGD